MPLQVCVQKKCMLAYGPIITNTLTNFKQVEEQLCYINKWHLNTPIWHNTHLMSGNKPFACKQWSDRGIYTVNQLFNEKGMLSFEDLRASFEVPRTPFFLYLR